MVPFGRIGAGLALATVAVLGTMSAPAGAQESTPIIFSSNEHGERLTCGNTWGDIYRLDGTTLTRLTNAREQTPDGDALCQIGYSRPVLSPDGTSIAAMRYEGSSTAIVVLNADGTKPRPVGYPAEGHARSASWSPDGTRLVHDGHDQPGLKIVSLDGSAANLIPNTFGFSDPAWSPDGAWIAFSYVPQENNPNQRGAIGVIRPDGTDLRQVTLDPDAAAAARPSWSPDGSAIAFESQLDGCASQVAIVPFEGARTYEPLAEPLCRAGSPWWLSNDRLVYWAAAETGAPDVYAVDRGGSTPVQLTQTAGGELDPASPPGGVLAPAPTTQATSTAAGPPLGATSDEGGSSLPILFAAVVAVLIVGYVIARRTVLAPAGGARVARRQTRERDREPSDHRSCVDRWDTAARAAESARSAAASHLGDSLESLAREWDGVIAALEEARAAFAPLAETEDLTEADQDDEDAVVRRLIEGLADEIGGAQR